MATPEVRLDTAALSRYLNRVVQPFLLRRAQEIADEAKALAPRGATGDLQESVTVRQGPKASAIVSVNAPHAGFVHQGTGPQHVPDPRPPYYPKLRRRGLILWAMTKGLDPYKVAQGISQTGTPPNPFLEQSIVKVLGKFSFRWIRRDLNI